MFCFQGSAACLLLTLTFNLVTATKCVTCPEGFFMVEICTTKNGWAVGGRCIECTNCSATNQQTVDKCFGTSNSVCGNLTVAPVEVDVPGVWMVIYGIVPLLVALMLLTLCLVLLYRRRWQKNFSAGGLSHL
ncbi:uncharacterized protein LOC142894065 isoform X2 [Nelusetta ayraudi]|uniref:uncharacterized protein LOC142894065 isoform X2 n=1 Tax=Nelusetta ayraudi TaxID=303726 RepID=UPI003F730E6A